jgi:hypothetical protein
MMVQSCSDSKVRALLAIPVLALMLIPVLVQGPVPVFALSSVLVLVTMDHPMSSYVSLLSSKSMVFMTMQLTYEDD